MLAALILASPAASGGHRIAPLWRADAVCETGRNPPPWNYGAPGKAGAGSGYEGGIGFAPSTWRWWSGKVPAARRFAHAYQAPGWVQALVAQWGLTNVGRWGCLFKPWVWALR